MKKNKEARPIFPAGLTDELLRLYHQVMAFKFKDPLNPPQNDYSESSMVVQWETLKENLAEDYDLNSPSTRYRFAWQQYFSLAQLHGFPTNKKQTNFMDTRDQRTTYVALIKGYWEEPRLQKTFVRPFLISPYHRH
jgi:hypothetical protein